MPRQQDYLPHLETTDGKNTCAYKDCKQPAKFVCGCCESNPPAYCSKDHQTRCWDTHRSVCNPVKVLRNDVLGRYMVSTRPIQTGETIFDEDPVVIGPKTDTIPICLGCYRVVDGSYRCSQCDWPMCKKECESATAHVDECKIFSTHAPRIAQQISSFEESCPLYECITPLRTLLLKENNKPAWEVVMGMEHHTDLRKQLPTWQVNQVNTVEFIRTHLKQTHWTEEEIHRVIGVLDVNAFEIRGFGVTVRGLYPRAAIMAHECVTNTGHHVQMDNYKLYVRATSDIPKDEQLLNTYTHTLWGTHERRAHLKGGKFFDCICKRCLDPTELGTHMSSLRCPTCVTGAVAAQDPTNEQDTAVWKCLDPNCNFQLCYRDIKKIISAIRCQVSWADRTVDKLEEMLKKFRHALHPNHWLLLDLKHTLSQLYGRSEGFLLDDLPDLLLERKIDLCRQLLSVADVVEPGMSRFRGVTLYELHAPLLMLAQRRSMHGEINKKELTNTLHQVQAILKEAAEILLLEDPNSPEGQMGTAAKVALQSTDELIANIDKLKAKKA